MKSIANVSFADSFPIPDSQISDRRHGFTLIELLISISIMIILGTVAFVNFSGVQNANNLTLTAKQMATVLRQAQTQAIQNYQGGTWGVRFANGVGTPSSSFYAFFSGAYSTATTVAYYKLPSTIAFVTSTLPASSTLDVIFTPLSGFAVSTSISVYLVGRSSVSSTISVSSSGEVSY
jgi:prepilin-type N-terminal cleavage/methylation domain-containing protein